MTSRRDAGDQHLLDALQATSADLLRFFLRRLDSADNAADALAEVHLTAWRRRSQAPSAPAEVRPWLYTIAANVLRNQRRSRTRAMKLAERLRSALAASPAVEDPAATVAESDEVRRALERLPPDSAELLRLVHWDGLSLAEASTAIGIPASTARSRYQAAKGHLREQLPLGRPS